MRIMTNSVRSVTPDLCAQASALLAEPHGFREFLASWPNPFTSRKSCDCPIARYLQRLGPVGFNPNGDNPEGCENAPDWARRFGRAFDAEPLPVSPARALEILDSVTT